MTRAERKRLWRQRQKATQQALAKTAEPTGGKKVPLEVEHDAIVKTLRTEIRLKHSLAADEEINATLRRASKAFWDLVQRSQSADLDDVRRALARASR